MFQILFKIKDPKFREEKVNNYLQVFNSVINMMPFNFSHTFFLNNSVILMKRVCLNSQTYLNNLLYLQKLQGTLKRKNITLSVLFIFSGAPSFFSYLTIGILSMNFTLT